MAQKSVKRERTLAVVILAALAALAGVLSLLDAARYMGWLPFTLGNGLKFAIPNAQWFAAMMAALVGVIFFVVAWWVWNLNPSGWLFIVVITIINLIFLFLAILGQTSINDVILQIVINAAALILALLPSTKAAFTPPAPAAKQVKSAQAKAKAPAAAATAATAAVIAETPAAPTPRKDDLTRIEGIGPAIANALRAAGVTSYAQLAAMTPDQIRVVLSKAGISGDPKTWPKQAQLAAAGQWRELKDYQAKLKGGRAV